MDAIPQDINKDINYFYANSYNGIQLYRALTEEEQEQDDIGSKERAREEEERKDRKNKLEDLFKIAFSMRFDFIKRYVPIKEHEDIIYKMIMMTVCKIDNSYRGKIDIALFNRIMNTTIQHPISIEKIQAGIASSEYKKALVALSYSALDSEESIEDCYDYNGCYYANESFEKLYEYLIKLGYEMSEEEKKLIDGTHELYLQEGEDEE